jgi:hypothetical protein
MLHPVSRGRLLVGQDSDCGRLLVGQDSDYRVVLSILKHRVRVKHRASGSKVTSTASA